MPGDTTQTFAPAMKFNYGGGILDAVRRGRKTKRTQQPAQGTSPTRATPQQDADRVRDALRLKPWL